MPFPKTTTMARIAGLLVLFAALHGCGSAEDAAESASGLPNILWLTSEDMSADLGAYGDAYAQTPHIDQLARQGVTYTNAFATAPVCSPARFTLLTGIYATTAGTQGLRSQAPIPDDITGFPAYLRELGYYTTNNVKTDYNTAAEPRLIAESWDESSAEAHWRGREDGQPFFAVFNHMHTHQSRISFLDTEFPELAGALGTHDPAAAPLPPYYPGRSRCAQDRGSLLRRRDRHGRPCGPPAGRTGGGRRGGQHPCVFLWGSRDGLAPRETGAVRFRPARSADYLFPPEMAAIWPRFRCRDRLRIAW